jgi:hypothetical protein
MRDVVMLSVITPSVVAPFVGAYSDFKNILATSNLGSAASLLTRLHERLLQQKTRVKNASDNLPWHLGRHTCCRCQGRHNFCQRHWHFGILALRHFGILKSWHLAFNILAFCQFASLPVCQFGILANENAANVASVNGA